MIIEVVIASVAAVTCVGTVFGLRFAAREMGFERTPKEQRDAVDTFERAVIRGDRKRVKAMLLACPESLPADVRERARAWVASDEGTWPVVR